MTDTLGLILANNDKIPPLTDIRTASALPVAGGFRIIDFILSSMANSGMTNIGVITDSNYSSLLEHIKSGELWGLDRIMGGLNIIPPNLAANDYGKYRGDIDMLSGAVDYLSRGREEYVILSLSNAIYNMDLSKPLEFHIKKGADITVIYTLENTPGTLESDEAVYIKCDLSGRLYDIFKNPLLPASDKAATGLYIMRRSLLLNIIDRCISRGEHDFIKDFIAKNSEKLSVFCYEYQGIFMRITSLGSYFDAQMSFLYDGIRESIFTPERPIITRNRDLAPTFYGDESFVDNSLISNGCVIDGCVKNSVLARGVTVMKGASVSNSVILRDCVISSGARVDHCLFDKNITVEPGKEMIGGKNYPAAVKNGANI